MQNPTKKDLECFIHEMNEKHPRSCGEISLREKDFHIYDDWHEEWPDNKHPGVYVFLNKKDEVLYVGKVSNNSCFGARLQAYLGYHPDDRNKPEIKHNALKDAGFLKIQTIALEKEFAFEAPAIEEFLIAKLNPPINTVGRRA